MKGRSAFSVYSEEKPSKQELEHPSKNYHHQLSSNKRNVQSVPKHKLSILGPRYNQGHEQQQAKNRRNEKQKLKKEKFKFSKLSTNDIRESIVMFNGKSLIGGQQQVQHLQPYHQKSNEFRVLSSSKQSNGKIGNPKRETKIKMVTKTVQNEIKSSKSNKLLQEEKNKRQILVEKEMDDINHLDDTHELIFDSRREAINVFNKMIDPVKHKEFFNQYWEKKPLLVKRGVSNYYANWFSCKEFDSIMRNHSLDFTQNIDVTSYVDGVKHKHNPEGRAYAPRVWDFFQQGCSIRLLNPATYSRNIWKYLSLLQEFFGSCVGSNIYLTPKGTQGFAPHYDDIEAFVLQLEGRKRWRVYKPLSEDTTLPRFSSENFNQSDLPEPILDIILESGDLLYFPRGFIHQANAVDDIHSLHITVSCYQLNSWGDFLTKLIPGAVENAIAEDVEFRRGLPIGSLNCNGIVYSDEGDNGILSKNHARERVEFRKRTIELFKRLVKYLPIDAAMDQMAKRYIHESLPPCLTEYEKVHSIHGHGETWNSKRNRVENISEIGPETSIKLIRKNCLRQVMENDSILIYHNIENTKIFCEKEPCPLEIQVEVAPAIEKLILSYPKYIRVDDLPIDSQEERIVVAQCLYDKGLLITEEPLDCDHEEVSEDEEANEEEDDEDEERASDDEDDFNSVDYDNNNNGEQEVTSSENSDESDFKGSEEDDEQEENKSIEDEDDEIENDDNNNDDDDNEE